MASNVSLISLRVLDRNGSGTDSGVIAAIEQAIALNSKYNIRIINLSLGRPVTESYKTDPLCAAVEAAWKAGMVVVVAAGNEGRNNTFNTNGYALISSPGNDPYVITVGAMRTMGTLWRAGDVITSYSSKGPTAIDHLVKPDLVAPGNRLASLRGGADLFSTQYPANIIALNEYMTLSWTMASPSYYKLSGTSMGAAVTSGAVALMLGNESKLSPDTVKARLMLTASKIFPSFSTATDPVTGQTFLARATFLRWALVTWILGRP